MERRLAAILAADVVGYSRLMAADETGTLDALKAHRAAVFDPAVARHGGRVFKLLGDGALVEFPSVVAAVDCAVAIQSATTDGPIRLRIGINLGDVIAEGGDIYGDGVNVAARLEGLADPGGICVSSTVHESAGNRVAAVFADTGEHRVKNIDRPIRVFRWRDASAASATQAPLMPAEMKREHTIAVAPFETLTAEDSLAYLGEGLSEDIVAALGHIAHLTVVSEAGEGARFLLTAKVRAAAGHLRVTARLTDRKTGRQHWTERFDSRADDPFSAQDEITRKIVIAVHTAVGSGSYTNRWQWGTEDFEAWQMNATAFRAFQTYSAASMRKAVALWEKSLERDPRYVGPRLAIAFSSAHLAMIADGTEREACLEKAEAAIARASAEAPHDSRIFSARRAYEMARGNHEEAVALSRAALEIEGDDPACRAGLSVALACAGRPAEALAHIDKAIADVYDPAGWFVMNRILCLHMLDRTDEALTAARTLAEQKPEIQPGLVLSAGLAAETGDEATAAAMRARVLLGDPDFSGDGFVRMLGLSDERYCRRLRDALIAAGLPE